MAYRIVEVDTATRSSKLYVLVHFWLSSQDPAIEPPHQIQDFKLDIHESRTGVRRDARGDMVKADGTTISYADFISLPIDDSERLTFQTTRYQNDVKALMTRFIEKYWSEELQRTGGPIQGSLTDPSLVTDSSDPRNILTVAREKRGESVP